MATLDNLVEEVLLNMEGFGAIQDTIAAASLGSTTSGLTTVTLTSPQLTDAAGITPTMLEVQDELMYVASATFGSGNLACQVRRGYRGTPTAGMWSVDEFARVNPRYPRVVVKRAINDTIEGLFPRLVAVKTASITYAANRYRYDLPSDARSVIAVSVPDPVVNSNWHPSRLWNFDETGGASVATVRSVEVRDGSPGEAFRVIYTTEPTALTTGSTDFSASGLPEWVREIVIYGACWRLASFMDAVSATGSHAAQMLMNEGQRDAAGRQEVARYFLGMFEARLAEGEARIRDLYPMLRPVTQPAPQGQQEQQQ